MDKVYGRSTYGQERAMMLAYNLVYHNVPFEYEPWPDDEHCFRVKPEYSHVLDVAMPDPVVYPLYETIKVVEADEITLDVGATVRPVHGIFNQLLVDVEGYRFWVHMHDLKMKGLL